MCSTAGDVIEVPDILVLHVEESWIGAFGLVRSAQHRAVPESSATQDISGTR
ncbi:hypothetical protein J2Y66_000709 [Paenarthrobacter nitroguajacolicus]|uniref:hypothetical protein n=1 Tax=Paenarthrobacter nitroguajacolicus TaxID=211146 RepID=UPI0028668FA7|nr:hypothetical protein [Paenarthrobacter nitroguajacolicus]MDR6986246.1 hypothetical protein [Paenarthrobacter nitroguajacolicus]